MHGPPSQSPASKLHWHSNAGLPQPRWLVKKLLPETGVALLSGQWSTGKTFMGLHLANRIWTGEPFAGRILNVAGERCGLRPKPLATSERDCMLSQRYRVYKTRCPSHGLMQYQSYQTRSALVKLIVVAREAAMEMQQKFGVPLAVILVDTMSAAAGFADENPRLMFSRSWTCFMN